MRDSVAELYGNRLRIRASGICVEQGMILLVNHNSLTATDFWAPPGGGIHFGERAEDCVKREFLEETGMVVSIKRFLFAGEFIQPPLHAIELFFEVSRQAGKLKKGKDPEMGTKTQIITEVKFVSPEEIKNKEANTLHGLFRLVENPAEILDLSGYFKL